jgi:hypothetical protein
MSSPESPQISELEAEILALLQEMRADCTILLATSRENLAIVKETNAMLAAHREALGGRGIGNG